jgi:hypothetical protein
MAKIDLDVLTDIAFAVEEGDPIDWGVFQNGKEESLKMIGASILDQFDKEVYTDEDRLIVMATITKLVAENMILHSQLMKLKSQGESE